MSGLTILAVAGCRPNFVKLGPLFREMKRQDAIRPLLVHTGQHYDRELSDLFFRDLELPRPDVHLGVGSGSHAVQTARVMEGMETTLEEHEPDLVLVVGDVNSTVAATLTAVKLGVPVAHVEAGLRSFDREMPEEVNRIATDGLADFLFATEKSGVENLRREGVAEERIRLVGNVMVDALLHNLDKIALSDVLERIQVAPSSYAVLTLHRPDNVDDPEAAAGILEAIGEIQARLPVVFPVHPRTRMRFAESGPWRDLERLSGVHLIDPLGYVDFLRLVQESAFVLTDSGGLQEETTVLGIPCLTLRDSTERPATIESGTNRLVGKDREAIVSAARDALEGRWPAAGRPELWDGQAARRIVETLLDEKERIHDLYRTLRRRTRCRRHEASVA